MKIAHVEASNVVSPIVSEEAYENVLKRVAGNATKGGLLRNLPKENRSGLEQIFESLNLNGVESWNEQQ